MRALEHVRQNTGTSVLKGREHVSRNYKGPA